MFPHVDEVDLSRLAASIAEEIARLAASIPLLRADARGRRLAYVQGVRDGPDHALNAPWGQRDGNQAYFGGEPVGPLFALPRDAVTIVALLNGRSGGGPVASDPPVPALTTPELPHEPAREPQTITKQVMAGPVDVTATLPSPPGARQPAAGAR